MFEIQRRLLQQCGSVWVGAPCFSDHPNGVDVDRQASVPKEEVLYTVLPLSTWSSGQDRSIPESHN